MGTIHAYLYVIYSTNSEEMTKFLKLLSNYGIVAPHGTKVYVFENCIYIRVCCDTVCSGQEGKRLAIESHIQTIETKILQDFPSFAVEFYFHHWHLGDYDKKGLFLGKESCLHKISLAKFSPFQNPGKFIDLTAFYGEASPNMWSTEEHLPSYIKKNGMERHLVTDESWVYLPEEPERCMIEDD